MYALLFSTVAHHRGTIRLLTHADISIATSCVRHGRKKDLKMLPVRHPAHRTGSESEEEWWTESRTDQNASAPCGGTHAPVAMAWQGETTLCFLTPCGSSHFHSALSTVQCQTKGAAQFRLVGVQNSEPSTLLLSKWILLGTGHSDESWAFPRTSKEWPHGQRECWQHWAGPSRCAPAKSLAASYGFSLLPGHFLSNLKWSNASVNIFQYVNYNKQKWGLKGLMTLKLII